METQLKTDWNASVYAQAMAAENGNVGNIGEWMGSNWTHKRTQEHTHKAIKIVNSRSICLSGGVWHSQGLRILQYREENGFSAPRKFELLLNLITLARWDLWVPKLRIDYYNSATMCVFYNLMIKLRGNAYPPVSTAFVSWHNVDEKVKLVSVTIWNSHGYIIALKSTPSIAVGMDPCS